MGRGAERGRLASGGETERIQVKKGDTCLVENSVDGVLLLSRVPKRDITVGVGEGGVRLMRKGLRHFDPG